MRKILHGLLALLGRALRMSFHARIRERVVILGGLALAVIAPLGTAGKLTSTLPIDGAAHATQAEPSTLLLAQDQRSGGPQAPDVQPPPRQLATEQPVAKLPQVTYEDGQLTINAENSLLSDILSAVHTVMGAEIDLPASASDQRIWVQLGPGPARRVLSKLLEGTELNYVIQASDTDVDGIQSVLLTPRSKTVETGGSGNQLTRGANLRIPRVNPGTAEVPEQENPAALEPVTSSDAAPTDPPAASTGSRSAAGEPQSAPGSPESNSSKPVARTSEEKIQQLQSLYQQRKQMQQGQKPPAPN